MVYFQIDAPVLGYRLCSEENIVRCNRKVKRYFVALQNFLD